MKEINYDYFHGTYTGKLSLETIDSKKFQPFTIGGKGLYVTSDYLYAKEKGHNVYSVQGRGVALDLNCEEDIGNFESFRSKFDLDLKDITKGVIYDRIATEYNLDIIILNQKVAVIKDLSSIEKFELSKIK
jgi:hypothetical protein